MVLDNATTELYYARLVPQENTLTTMQALRAAVEKRRGVFCTLYTDMASHFVTTRCADAPHRNQKPCLPPTQIQRALGAAEHRVDPGPFAPGQREDGVAVVNENCLQFQKLKLQIPPCHWRYSFAKCQVNGLPTPQWHHKNRLRPTHPGPI